MIEIQEIKEELSLICDTALERFLMLDNANLKERLRFTEMNLENITDDRDIAEKKYEDLLKDYKKISNDFNVAYEELKLLSNIINVLANNALFCNDFIAFNTLKIKDKESLEIVKEIDKITGSNYLDKAIDVLAQNSIKVVKEDNNG